MGIVPCKIEPRRRGYLASITHGLWAGAVAEKEEEEDEN